MKPVAWQIAVAEGTTGPTLRPNCLRDESGQDLIEYALLTSVLSVGFIGTIQALADGVIPFFDKVLAAFHRCSAVHAAASTGMNL